MKKLVYIFAIAILISCSERSNIPQLNVSGYAQGTTFNISYVDSLERDFSDEINGILQKVDESMSLWKENSHIKRLNNGDTIVGDTLLQKVVQRSLGIGRQTKGALDITLGPIISVWGFGRQHPTEVDSTIIDSLKQYQGLSKIHLSVDSLFLDKGVKIDLNAIAQGYSVDLVSDFLKSQGIKNYMVEIGGEVFAQGKNHMGRTWRLGIDKPSEEIQVDRFQAIIQLDKIGLATSGNYRKFWVDEATGMKYQHTINPKTGFPVRSNLLSVSILAPTAMDADAFATACMVIGVDAAKNLILSSPDLEGMLIYSDEKGNWKEWQSEGFKRVRL